MRVVRILRSKKEKYYKQELRAALSVTSRFFFGCKSVSLLNLYLRKLKKSITRQRY
jgi:hypothetical protein